MTSARATVLTVIVALMVSTCARHAAPPAARTPLPAPVPEAQQTPGLRQTFESLSPGTAHPARIELLDDNLEAWAARWRLLARARETIDVSYFILHEDVFGLSFLGHLLERARAGVRIRILFDGFGTAISREIMGNAFLEQLAAEKSVRVRTYRPLWRRWTGQSMRR